MAYCTQSDIEDVFGSTNVAKWADLNNNEESSEITARIARAITFATAAVDGVLRGGVVTVPITGTPDPLIVDACAKIAGAWLYNSRGMQDIDEGETKLSMANKEAREMLVRIKIGETRLEAAPVDRMYPTADVDSEEDETASGEPWLT